MDKISNRRKEAAQTNETTIQTPEIPGRCGKGSGGCICRTAIPDTDLHDGQGKRILPAVHNGRRRLHRLEQPEDCLGTFRYRHIGTHSENTAGKPD